MSFQARYGGECNECGAWFEPGTVVRYDATDSIVHAVADDCVTQAGMERAEQEPPCALCFCWHAGDCA